MISFRKRYAPGYCEYKKKYKEIRWDVMGCNLRCQFCWSPASRPEETGEKSELRSTGHVFRETSQKAIDPQNTFIRFTG